MPRFIQWTMALLACAACDSSSTSVPDGPLTGADGPRIDGPSSPVDGAPGGGDGGTTFTCAMSISAYCASSGTCISSWNDVPTCGSQHDATRTCGSLQAFVEGGVDTSKTSYYDAAGNLVAIVNFGLGHFSCTAGPSSFFAPDCGELHPLPSCPDAGT